MTYQIPNPADVGTPDAANVSVSTLFQGGLTLEAFSAHWIASVTGQPGGALLDRVDGQDPAADRFVLLTARQGDTPYVVADRYAKRGSFFVHVRAAWPTLRATTAEWEASLVKDVNALVSSIRIDGKAIGTVGGLVILEH